MIFAFAAVFGMVVGSFLNVCIHRMPKNESIVWPGSHCQSCKHPLSIADNIPILSYLWLGGKCKYCSGLKKCNSWTQNEKHAKKPNDKARYECKW